MPSITNYARMMMMVVANLIQGWSYNNKRCGVLLLDQIKMSSLGGKRAPMFTPQRLLKDSTYIHSRSEHFTCDLT